MITTKDNLCRVMATEASFFSFEWVFTVFWTSIHISQKQKILAKFNMRKISDEGRLTRGETLIEGTKTDALDDAKVKFNLASHSAYNSPAEIRKSNLKSDSSMKTHPGYDLEGQNGVEETDFFDDDDEDDVFTPKTEKKLDSGHKDSAATFTSFKSGSHKSSNFIHDGEMFYTKKEYMDVAEIQHRQTFQQKPGTPETKRKGKDLVFSRITGSDFSKSFFTAMTKNKTLYQRRATGYEPRELDDGDGNLPMDSSDKRLTSRVTEVRSTIDDINDNIIVQTDSNTQAAQLQGTQRKTYYFNGYRVEEERGGPTVSTEDRFSIFHPTS